MKVFLTGGTGFVGNYILEELVRNKFDVRCLIRAGSEKKIRLKEGYEVFHGDVLDYESLVGGMEGCDVVINLVGIIREFPGKGITFERLHFLATKNCVDAAGEKGVKRFLQMSALGTRKDAVSSYHKTKFRAEEYVRKSGLIYTIFRPSLIFGREDKSINLFAENIRRLPFFPVFGDGDYKTQPVSVLNVAQGFARAINSRKAHNKTFELGGPKKYTFNELLDAIGRVMDKRVRKAHLPLFMVKPVVNIIGRFSFAPVTSEQLTMLLEDNVCDEKEFYRALSIEPISLEDGIGEYMK